MKYKVGQKFVVEIESAYKFAIGSTTGPALLYRIKGFNSLVFDEDGLDKLVPVGSVPELALSFDKGLETADQTYRALANMPNQARMALFGTTTVEGIIQDHKYSEIRAAASAYYDTSALPYCAEVELLDHVYGGAREFEKGELLVVLEPVEDGSNYILVDRRGRAGTFDRAWLRSTGKTYKSLSEFLHS